MSGFVQVLEKMGAECVFNHAAHTHGVVDEAGLDFALRSALLKRDLPLIRKLAGGRDVMRCMISTPE